MNFNKKLNAQILSINEQLPKLEILESVNEQYKQVVSNLSDLKVIKLSNAELESKCFSNSQYCAELEVQLISLQNRMNEFLRERENADVLYRIDDLVQKVSHSNKQMETMTEAVQELQNLENVPGEIIQIRSKLNEVITESVSLGQISEETKVKIEELRRVEDDSQKNIILLRGQISKLPEIEQNIAQFKQLVLMAEKSMAQVSEDREEIRRIWSYLDQYVNQQANFIRRTINLTDFTTKEKMQSIEWILRNIEYISPQIIDQFITNYSEILSIPTLSPLKISLSTTKHTSEVIITAFNLIKDNLTSSLSIESNDETQIFPLQYYLAISELLLNSDSNFDRASGIGTNFIDILMKIVFAQIKDPIYRLSSLRVISVFIRDPTSYLVLQNQKFLHYFISVLENPTYDLSLVHVVRVVRVCLRTIQGIDLYYKNCQGIYLYLNNILVNGAGDQELAEQTLAALRNYTQQTEYLDQIDPPSLLNKVIEIAGERQSVRKQQIALAILRNCIRDNRLLSLIRISGVYDSIFIQQQNEKSTTNNNIKPID